MSLADWCRTKKNGFCVRLCGVLDALCTCVCCAGWWWWWRRWCCCFKCVIIRVLKLQCNGNHKDAINQNIKLCRVFFGTAKRITIQMAHTHIRMYCVILYTLHTYTRTHSCDQIDSIITSVTFCRPFLPHSFRMRFVAIILLDRFDAVVAVAHTRTTADVDAASIWFLRYFASFYVFLVHRIGILPLFGRFGFGHFILNLYVHTYCVCIGCC